MGFGLAVAFVAVALEPFDDLRDQFADLRKGIFISMPIGTVLAALILAALSCLVVSRGLFPGRPPTSEK